jgi:sec-independent protein translocase protein TatC
MDRDTLITQLERLRWAIIRTLVALLVAAIAGYAVSRQLLQVLHRPLGHVKLQFLRLTEPFFAYIKIGLFAGFFIVLPFLIRELWLAAAPLAVGAQATRRLVWPVTIVASGLFYAGAAVCYFFVLDAAVPFLLNFAGGQVQPFLSVSDYLSLVMTLLLASGLMFELPLVLLVLGRFGVVDARMLGRFRRYALVLNAILAAVLTPTPDVYTMVLMMVPLALLYEVSVVLVRLFGKPREFRVRAAAT